MDVFDLAAKITLDDSGYKSGLEKAKGAFAGAAKFIGGTLTAGLAAGSAAVLKLSKDAVSAYGEFQQLSGGIDKLFGEEAAKQIQSYAENAYETAGMSANAYMQNITGFSAALINSVGGDSVEAAKIADMAMRDIADNANTYGKYTAEELAGVYQALAKGQYQTLDNLNLGFGGTKEGLQALLDKAEELSGVKYDIGNFADIAQAIHVVQDDMNIAGTTLNEAAGTIQGSLSMMKAAWENLVTGLSDPKADLGKLMNNFTKSAKTALNNILPAVRTALKGIGTAVKELAPVISQELPGLISDLLPGVLDAATSLVSSVVAGLPGILKGLIGAVPGIVRQLASALSKAWKSIEWDDVMDTGKNLLTSIGEGVKTAVGNVREWVTNIVGKLGSYVSEHWEEIKAKGGEILTAIGRGVLAGVQQIGIWISSIATSIGTFITDNGPDIMEKGKELLGKIGDGYINAVSQVHEWMRNVITEILTWIDTNSKDTEEPGSNLLDAIGNGFKSAIATVGGWFSRIVSEWGAWISQNKELLISVGSNLVGKLWRGFKDAVSTVGEWVGEIYTTITTYLTDHGDELVAKGGEILGSIWEGFKAAVSSVGSWVGEILTNMLTSLADGEEDEDSDSVGDSLLAKVGNGFIKAAVNAGTWLLDVLASIATWIVDHRELIALAGWNLLKGIGKGFANAAILVLGWMGTIVANIAAWFNDSANIEKLKEFGKSIITKLGQGLADMWESVKSWAGDIFDKVKEGAGEAWSTITGIGSDIIEKIKAGIIEKWEGLKAWFRSLLNGLVGEDTVIGTTKSYLQSHPSVMDHDAMSAIGIDYVPRNNYSALLHRGEAVLTREEARQWRAGQSGNGSGMTVNIYAQEVTQATVDYIIARADAELGGLLA